MANSRMLLCFTKITFLYKKREYKNKDVNPRNRTVKRVFAYTANLLLLLYRRKETSGLSETETLVEKRCEERGGGLVTLSVEEVGVVNAAVKIAFLTS